MRPQPSDAVPCANADEGCPNSARGRRHKYCETCHKRTLRGSTRRRPTYTSPEDRAEALALALADVSSEDDAAWDKARRAFRQALRAMRDKAAEEARRAALAEYVSKSLGAWEGGMLAPGHDVPASNDSAERGREQRQSCEEAATPGAGKALPEG